LDLKGLDGTIHAWLEGLASAVLMIADRLRPGAVYVVSKAQDDTQAGWLVHRQSGQGRDLAGRLVEEDGALQLQPRPLAGAMKGCDLRVTVPDGWILKRALEPVPLRSRPFLDAYVRRQIERVTPWRAEDCLYGVDLSPAGDGGDRLDVQVQVLLRRLVHPVIATVTPLRPRHVCLQTAQAGLADKGIILQAIEGRRLADCKRRVGIGVAVLAVSLTAAIFATSWYQAVQAAAIAELDDAITARRQQISAIHARMTTRDAHTDQVPAAALPPVARVLDWLSQILPDTAYLTGFELEAGQVRISGMAQENVAGLIPLIERSPYFVNAHFYAPTTRLDDEAGQRFFIAMAVAGATGPDEGKP
jgi:general secretion pathway protein L